MTDLAIRFSSLPLDVLDDIFGDKLGLLPLDVGNYAFGSQAFASHPNLPIQKGVICLTK